MAWVMARVAEMMRCMHILEDREQDADAVAEQRGAFRPDIRPVHHKSEEKSALLRQQGNAAFYRENLLEAMRKYTRSVAAAPCEGNTTGLALAFESRSAVHFSLLNYEDCLSDIAQALKVDYPSRLRYMVLKRRAKCYQAMGNMDAARKNLEEAIARCLEEDKKRSMEQELAALKPPEQVYKPRLRIRPPPELHLGENPKIPGASACIEIKYNEKYGRHLVATEDIPPGVVLIVEEPIGSLLHPDKCDEYCFRCMCRCNAMIPCKSCTIVMYCSEECRELSWAESHDLECAIFEKLTAADMDKIYIFLLLRLFVVALKKHGNLRQLYDYITQLDTEVIEGNSGCDAEGSFDPINLRFFYNLAQSNPIEKFNDRCAQYCEFLLDCIDEKSQLLLGVDTKLKRFTGRLLMRFLRILMFNAYGVNDWTTEECDEIGLAVYSISSLLKHRRIPISNAAQYQRGDTIVVYTNLPIEKGEQVFVSYRGELRGKIGAAAELLIFESKYALTCGCGRCTNPSVKLCVFPLCPKCRTAVYATPELEMVNCPFCDNCFNASHIISAALISMLTMEQLWTQLTNAAIIPDLCKIITKLHRTVLLPNIILFLMQKLLGKAVTHAGLK